MNVKRDGKNITTDTEKLKLLDTARELTSRKPKPEPHSEYYAKVALKTHSEYLRQEDDKRKLKSDFNLGCMEIALELEKDRKKLETTAEELASRNSKPETDSEFLAKCALRAHKEDDQKECDKYLIYMGYHLKEENWKDEKEKKFKEERLKELLDTAKELASRNSNPEPESERYAKHAFEIRKVYDRFLIEMEWHLKKENNITNTTTWLEESLETAKKLASQESNPEPNPEHFAKNALLYHFHHMTEITQEQSSKWKQEFIGQLGCMEIALEQEKDQKDRKELKITAEELASRGSKPEPESEYWARRALSAYRDSNRHLTSMKSLLKKEKELLTLQNSNPGPDEPTLQTLREKRKEETLKEQETQPQIKRGRSR